MGEPKGKCPKCMKPYERLGIRYEKHVAECKGGTWRAPVPRSSRKKPGVEEPEEPEARTSIDQVISFIRSRKVDLEREREILKAQVKVLDNEVGHLQETVDMLIQAKKA